MYSADVDLFHQYYNETKEAKENKFPHRFIYVGRYTELKGIRELWQAFSSLSDDERKGWELWCLGKGELHPEFPKNDSIKDFGFVQPDQLKKYLIDTGVFILPTHYEHWGVVVHEYAASGFPMICSTTTSAATTFLKEGENGFFCQPKSVESVRKSLLKIINSSDEQLIAMGKKSVELSNMITPDTWADTIMSLVK
jgi:glycosyltransferase involved in cell wall biosynthesis